eukprot:scaffold7353_cov87-Cylindrotheca_fusiformis.AAC.7
MLTGRRCFSCGICNDALRNDALVSTPAKNTLESRFAPSTATHETYCPSSVSGRNLLKKPFIITSRAINNQHSVFQIPTIFQLVQMAARGLLPELHVSSFPDVSCCDETVMLCLALMLLFCRHPVSVNVCLAF